MFSMLMLRDTSFDNMKLLFDRGARHVFFPPPHTPPHPHPHAMSAPASLPSFEELHFPRGTLRHSFPRVTLGSSGSSICLFVIRRFNSELSFCFSFLIGARSVFSSWVTTLSAPFAVSFAPLSLEGCPVAMLEVTVQGHSRPRILCVGAPACSNHIVNSE